MVQSPAGAMQNLPITALKLTLGIFNRKCRDYPHAWRILGNVAAVSKPKTAGAELFAATEHLDAEEPDLTDEEEEYEVDPDLPTCKAQDFHTMLDCLLESYRDVQKRGFFWDLRYRGKTYTDVEFVPFLMFIKCDTEEGDLLCGSYTVRTGHIAHLCRYCHCPTQESDLVRAQFPPKTTEGVTLLVKAKDKEGLAAISQQYIQNAWYRIRFGPHNKRGVHGACPSDMLHAILLGIFKYTRECFFEQIGKDSKPADVINALAQTYGAAFGRQSERDVPLCKFKSGIRKGKLMAKEFRGVLLVMAALLRSTKGRELLRPNTNFRTEVQIKDWTVLVEMLLQWEAFLNSPEMRMREVIQLKKKNRYLMYVLKRVGDRATGMGLKLTKFHIIVHLWEDIRFFGVPLEFDTGSNESAHKETKVAAKLTQKNELTFDFQTCIRLDEFLAIDLAMAELDQKVAVWRYFHRPETPGRKQPRREPPPSTSGSCINVFLHHESGPGPVYSMGDKKKARTTPDNKQTWGKDIVHFLFRLKLKLGGDVSGRLRILTLHKRQGLIFRGSPCFDGKPWRDWAMFDWGGEDGVLPGHIWCFVVIKSVPGDANTALQHGGIDLVPGSYAVVETANWEDNAREVAKSGIFRPIKKVVKQKQAAARGWKRRFYLADVEAITKPCIVVPDVGGREGIEFFVVKNRSQWAKDFQCWLGKPSEEDVIGPEEPMPSHG